MLREFRKLRFGRESIIGVLIMFSISTPSYSQLDLWEQTATHSGTAVMNASSSFSFLAVNNNGEIFVSTDKGILRSSDDGASWGRISRGFNTSARTHAVNSDGNLFAATYSGDWYRSTDNGASWLQINGPNKVMALAVTSNGHILAGTMHDDFDKGIFLSADNGNSWRQANPGGRYMRYISAMAVDSDGRVFASNGSVYLSTDNGLNWTKISNVSRSGPSALAVNSKNELFAGTNCGVYRSVDHGYHWEKVNFGLPSKFKGVTALAINSKDYVFTSNRVGIFLSTDNGDSWFKCGSQSSLTADLARTWDLALTREEKLVAIGNGIYRSLQSTTSIKKTAYSHTRWQRLKYTIEPAVQPFCILSIFILGIISVIRRARPGKIIWDILIPVTSLMLYFIYESTVTENIRIDLLILYPFLFAIVILNSISFLKNQDGAPTNEVIETAGPEGATSINHFTRTIAVNHFFWGFVRPDDADIEKVIADAVKQNSGTRAINITIEFKQTFLKNLVGVVTIGIYLPRTLKIEGDVVK